MKIIYKTEKGISIVSPTGAIPIEAVFEKDIPLQYKASAQIVEDSVIPIDYTFRDAWEFDGKKITENLDKVKEIQKEKLRILRKPLLDEQDILFIQSLEGNKDTVEIIAEKQRLRDIPQLVDNCLTINEVKQIII